jgi:hypothetical protein
LVNRWLTLRFHGKKTYTCLAAEPAAAIFVPSKRRATSGRFRGRKPKLCNADMQVIPKPLHAKSDGVIVKVLFYADRETSATR